MSPSLNASLAEGSPACLRRFDLNGNELEEGSVRMRRQGGGRVAHPLRTIHPGSPRAPPAAQARRKAYRVGGKGPFTASRAAEGKCPPPLPHTASSEPARLSPFPMINGLTRYRRASFFSTEGGSEGSPLPSHRGRGRHVAQTLPLRACSPRCVSRSSSASEGVVGGLCWLKISPQGQRARVRRAHPASIRPSREWGHHHPCLSHEKRRRDPSPIA